MTDRQTSEKWLEEAEKIMDESCCYNSVEDEVLKLICLLSRCSSSIKQDGEDFLSRSYVLDKATRILQGVPIILDSETRKMYASIKMENKTF